MREDINFYQSSEPPASIHPGDNVHLSAGRSDIWADVLQAHEYGDGRFVGAVTLVRGCMVSNLSIGEQIAFGGESVHKVVRPPTP